MYKKEAQFDKQGMLFYSLCKQAGWSNTAIQNFLVNKYKKTHFNILHENEKRQVIAIAKAYAEKADITNAKAIRQRIVATWRKAGLSIDDLHHYMQAWGFPNSLRACSTKQLIQIKNYVNIATKENKNGQKNK